MLACETIRLCPPELPTATEYVAPLPRGTLPKFTVDGLAVNCPKAPAEKRKRNVSTSRHFTAFSCELRSLTASPLVGRKYCSAGECGTLLSFGRCHQKIEAVPSLIVFLVACRAADHERMLGNPSIGVARMSQRTGNLTPKLGTSCGSEVHR